MALHSSSSAVRCSELSKHFEAARREKRGDRHWISANVVMVPVTLMYATFVQDVAEDNLVVR